MSITWSITIPAFNSADYLEGTLISVLKQDLGPERMEIVVVDNCSTDDTPNLVRRVGKGRIKFIANEKNIGAYGNFNKCVDVAKGELIHLLNSDDVVNPGFYAEFEAAFTDKEVYLVSCNSEVIDETGGYRYTTAPITSLLQPSNNTEGLLTYNKFRTPAVVVRRAAYEVVGRFDTQLVQTADWDMWIRVIHQFKGLHLDRPLCQYREHSNNGSSRIMLSGGNILDTERLHNKFKSANYPVDSAAQRQYLTTVARDQYIQYAQDNNRVGKRNILAIYTRMAGLAYGIRLQAKTAFGQLKKILSSKILKR